MFIENWWFSIIVTITLLWLGFYFGTYYGKETYRCCRYWKLKTKRIFQGRYKYKTKIVLSK